jgi:hypothetical protein
VNCITVALLSVYVLVYAVAATSIAHYTVITAYMMLTADTTASRGPVYARTKAHVTCVLVDR